MGIDTDPTSDTYVTGITKLFWMPTDEGGVPAVAVSKSAFGYISSVYTILIFLIFMVGWAPILASSMEFWPKSDNPDRLSLLDDIRKSANSKDAMRVMVPYCGREILNMLGREPKDATSALESKRVQPSRVHQSPDTRSNGNSPPKEITEVIQEEQNQTRESPSPSNSRRRARNLLWDLLFVFFALAMTVGNFVAGILVPARLLIGGVASVDKDSIFYPDVTRFGGIDYTGAGYAKLDLLRTPSVLRALGVIELSASTVRKRVNLTTDMSDDSAYLSYDYNVTGVDMGLQSDPKLKLMVKGSCSTDYTLVLNSTTNMDTYKIPDSNDTLEVKNRPELGLPPTADFWIDMDTSVWGPRGSNVSFGIVAFTAGLYSHTSSLDPWYSTNRSGVNGSAAYRVVVGRPALNCWEANKWHLNGRDVDVLGLNASALPGLKLHKLWANTVFPYEFYFPRIVIVGSAAGLSALKSASYSSAPDFILDAGTSSLSDDFERLVLASWVSSRNVLRETTRYKSGDLVNFAKGAGGLVEAASAKFVLESSDVATLSVRVLISVPAILLFLFLVQGTLSWVFRHPKSQKMG